MRQVQAPCPLFIEDHHRHNRRRGASGSSSSSLLHKQELDSFNGNRNSSRLRVSKNDTPSVSCKEDQPHEYHHPQQQNNRSKSQLKNQAKVKTNNRLLRRFLKNKKSHDSEETSCCPTLQSIDSSLQTKKKAVSFGKVHVREHARLLGDHPSCPDGLSLGLDWMHGERVTIMAVDLFERSHKRGGQGKARRLQSFERKVILKVLGGYEEDELMKAYFSHQRGTSPAA